VGRDIRQIIAMGGGAFSADPEHLTLEKYVLAQTRARRPRVCFVATATGDNDEYVARFYSAFTRLRCHPAHLGFFARTPDVRQRLLSQDVIYVGGGNTKSMLAVWREWDLPRILREAWRRGIILTGVSAGAICWFTHGITDSWADELRVLPCLGLLPGTGCPHYDGEADRRPSVHRFVTKQTVARVLALDDGAAAHFTGRVLTRVVASGPRATGYDVRLQRGRLTETPYPAVRLARRAVRGI
jgi:dipeptidase E